MCAGSGIARFGQGHGRAFRVLCESVQRAIASSTNISSSRQAFADLEGKFHRGLFNGAAREPSFQIAVSLYICHVILDGRQLVGDLLHGLFRESPFAPCRILVDFENEGSALDHQCRTKGVAVVRRGRKRHINRLAASPGEHVAPVLPVAGRRGVKTHRDLNCGVLRKEVVDCFGAIDAVLGLKDSLDTFFRSSDFQTCRHLPVGARAKVAQEGLTRAVVAEIVENPRARAIEHDLLPGRSAVRWVGCGCAGMPPNGKPAKENGYCGC